MIPHSTTVPQIRFNHVSYANFGVALDVLSFAHPDLFEILLDEITVLIPDTGIEIKLRQLYDMMPQSPWARKLGDDHWAEQLRRGVEDDVPSHKLASAPVALPYAANEADGKKRVPPRP